MAKMDEKRRQKILYGNLWKVIISIATPLFIYQFFNSFYSLIDTIFANQISTSSVSSVAALAQVKNLLTSFGAGIGAGVGIIVARLFGAGNYDEAKENANCGFYLVVITGIVISAICIALAYPICSISGISSEQASAATGYFTVQMIEVFVVSLNCVFIALQKAKGNTKIIFYLNILTMIVKVLLNCLFIFGIGVDDIIWIAVATLISQVVLFIILFIIMINKNNIFRISLRRFCLRWKLIKPILVLSIPIFIGKFIFSFGKVAVNSIFGAGYLRILEADIDMTDPMQVEKAEALAGLVVGALAVSNNINGLATSPINTFEETGSTIVSQNIGNRNLKRVVEAFIKNFIIATALGVIGWILIRFVFQDALIGLFKGKNGEGELANEFMDYVRRINVWDSLSIPSLAINSAVLGALYGLGKTKLTAVINIARAFVFRVPILILLLTCFPQLGVECAGYSMGISNICIALMSLICLLVVYIRIKKHGYDGMYLDGRDMKKEANEEVIA